MKKTALNNIHKQLGAKMLPFAGFEMPIQYSGVNDEHLCVRNAVGVFDVSHMGEFIVEGDNALDFLQVVSSNDVSKLFDGKVQYACFPNEIGGIVDDLLVYKIHDGKYMLVVNGANIQKDWEWVNKQNHHGAKISDISDEISLLAVQGPMAAAVLQKLTTISLSEMPYYTFKVATFAGVDDVIISTTGYTGAGGFEIYFKNEFAEEIWQQIFDAGKEQGIKPIGLAARDTLRLEMGFCLYGNDINDTTSPIAAGLGWITKFSKDFINKENLLLQKQNGVDKKLVGLELLDKGIARQHHLIYDKNDNLIGEVTSGTMSPSLKKAIAMGYVSSVFSEEGTEVYIEIRNKKIAAKVVKFPFLKS